MADWRGTAGGGEQLAESAAQNVLVFTATKRVHVQQGGNHDDC